MGLDPATISHILNLLFNATAYTPPSTYYVALGTDAEPDGSTFTEIGTVGVDGYARVSKAANNTNFSTSAAGSDIHNLVVVTFPTVATVDWGTARDFALFDAATAGNKIAYGVLLASQICAVGDTPSFAISALVAHLV